MSESFHNIFDKYVPMWRNAVSRYAKALWTNNVTEKTDLEYNQKALYFSREYRNSLEKYYAEKGMRVYRGTLSGYVYEWLKKQQALKDTLKVIADEKQNKLIKDALEKLKDTKDAQKVIDEIYGAKEGETVYKVFSFKENFEALAKQRGEENAFDLGTGINERIIQHFSDRYFWKTQKDKRVRDTHMQLMDLCFLFLNPPTTIDKYGNKHTGNPGTDYGCVPSGTRIRLNSDVIRCFRRRFTGDLSVISTESGVMLRATGNHPVLTQSGWKPANLVEVGDYIFKVPDKSIKEGERDIYDIGIPIEKVFDFFSLCGDTESVPGSASQFHGDGIPEEKVDIVTVNRELTDKRNIETGEFISKLIFTNPDVMTSELFGACDSELNSLFFWLGLAFFGDISGSGDFLSLFGSGIFKSDDIGLTSITGNNSILNEHILYKSSFMSTPKILERASENAHSAFITLDDLVPERVVDIGTEIFDGHVFNLQTTTSWYIANGLSIHNCRCFAELAPEREKVLKNYIVYEK